MDLVFGILSLFLSFFLTEYVLEEEKEKKKTKEDLILQRLVKKICCVSPFLFLL